MQKYTNLYIYEAKLLKIGLKHIPSEYSEPNESVRLTNVGGAYWDLNPD